MNNTAHDLIHLVNAKVIQPTPKAYECTIGALTGCYIPKSECEYDEFTGTMLVKRWLLNKNRDKWHITFANGAKAYGSDETLPAIHYTSVIRTHMREIEHCLKQLDDAMSYKPDPDNPI